MSAIATSSASEVLPDSHHGIKDYPRSPSSLSPLSRKDSLQNKFSESQAPGSPPSRLIRKRAASLNTDAANRLEDLVLSGDGVSGTGRDHVCLCQPDPKIPRPRNAFILYRQHYQAQVVAQHPGLANPEISKIIGEQWRDQPIEIKNDWKRLAEEEKVRHQLQYPDYRYQPKRAGKVTAEKTLSPDGGNSRCPKCGGRYILTPSAPLTPFERSSRLPTPIKSASNSDSPPRSSLFGKNLPRLPHNFPPFPQMDRDRIERTERRPYPPTPRERVGLQLRPIRDHHDEDEFTSPNYKRRRFDPYLLSAPYAPATPINYGSSSSQRILRPSMPLSAGFYPEERRRGFQPGPGPYGGMEPPPRPGGMGIGMGHGQGYITPSPIERGHEERDRDRESLRLPPLQTPTSTSISHGIGGIGAGMPLSRTDNYQRSVQAMVMTIPYLNKIKVLAKISPSLAPSSPTSPSREIRGAVIAVEGADPQLVAEVGKFLQDHLSREPECFVKTWFPSPHSKSSRSFSGHRSPRDLEMSDASNLSPASGSVNNDFLQYLDEIHYWHTTSAEIIKFVTTIPSPSSSPAPAAVSTPSDQTATERTPLPSTNTPSSSSSQSRKSSTAIPENEVESSTSTTDLNMHPGKINEATLNNSSNSNDNNNNNKKKIPIALLPHGFSVTTSDIYASSIPINDAYAPVDHWQWMATLWRGIVGPDLTVYVKSVNEAGSTTPHPSDSSARDRDVGRDSGREELASWGGVEVRGDCKVIVVRTEGRVEEGKEGVEEKTLRRLGFEVLEFVRGEGGTGRFHRM